MKNAYNVRYLVRPLSYSSLLFADETRHSPVLLMYIVYYSATNFSDPPKTGANVAVDLFSLLPSAYSVVHVCHHHHNRQQRHRQISL